MGLRRIATRFMSRLLSEEQKENLVSARPLMFDNLVVTDVRMCSTVMLWLTLQWAFHFVETYKYNDQLNKLQASREGCHICSYLFY